MVTHTATVGKSRRTLSTVTTGTAACVQVLKSLTLTSSVFRDGHNISCGFTVQCF
jgi:hypothetical protein